MSKITEPSVPHRVPPYKRPIIIGGFLILLAAAIGVTILVFKLVGSSPQESPAPDPSTSQPTTPPTTPVTPSDDLENKAPQYEGDDPNTLPSLTGNIIYKDIDYDTDTLHSAVSIDQYLQNPGQCVYNIRRDDAILRTASSIIEADATTSFCGPFAISLSDLPPGTYQIEVFVTGDDKQGTITDQLEL